MAASLVAMKKDLIHKGKFFISTPAEDTAITVAAMSDTEPVPYTDAE